MESAYVQLDQAISSGAPTISALARELGQNAASWGLPLNELLDRVVSAHHGQDATVHVIRSAAEGWADAMTWWKSSATCADPLSGLTSVAHLRTELEGLYRKAQFTKKQVGEKYALLIVEATSQPRDGIESALLALDFAEVLKTVFVGDETFTELSRRRFGVLARRSRLDGGAVDVVTVLLRRLQQTPAPRLWIEFLPNDEDDLVWVLEGLTT